jgi:hypothetical protein
MSIQIIDRLQNDPNAFCETEVVETLDAHYNNIAKFVEGFGRGLFEKRGLIVNGPAGGGKTQIVKSVLKSIGTDFVSISGTITAPSLFIKLYETRKRGQILLIDDTDAVLETTEMADILKGAIDTGAPKEISYNKSSPVLRLADVPNQFVFSGGVILITNKHININNCTSREEQRLRPIWGRCNYISAGLDPLWTEQAIRLLFKHDKITCLKESGLPHEVQQEIVDFAIERWGGTKALSFRSLISCIDMYRLCSENWREFVAMSGGNA